MKITGREATLAALIATTMGCTSSLEEPQAEVTQPVEKAAALKEKKECFQLGKTTDDGGAYHYCLVRSYRRGSGGDGLVTVSGDVLARCEMTVRWSKEPPLMYWYTYSFVDCVDPPTTGRSGPISTNIRPKDGVFEVGELDQIVRLLLAAAQDGSATPWNPEGVYSWAAARWIFDRQEGVEIEPVVIEASK